MSRELGTVREVIVSDGLVRLTVDVHGELVGDVAVASPLRHAALDVQPGDRVLVEEPSGADAERIATPYELLTQVDRFEIAVGDFRIIINQTNVEIRTAAGIAVPLAPLADLQAHRDWAATHTHPDPATGFTGAPADMTGPTPPPEPAGTEVLHGE